MYSCHFRAYCILSALHHILYSRVLDPHLIAFSIAAHATRFQGLLGSIGRPQPVPSVGIALTFDGHHVPIFVTREYFRHSTHSKNNPTANSFKFVTLGGSGSPDISGTRYDMGWERVKKCGYGLNIATGYESLCM